jgi:hypothetical protein
LLDVSVVRVRKTLIAPALAFVTLALLLGAYTPPAQSACASPTIHVAYRGPYGVGDSIVIRGRYWTGECNDVIACSVGCFGHESCSGGGPPAPAQNIALELRGHGRSVPLADGLEGLSFSAEATIPGVPPGIYWIEGNSPDTGPWRSQPLRIGHH